MKETIQPLGDRIIIKAPTEGNTKKGRIIVQESTSRGESTWGEVLLVGPGIYTQTGDLIPMSVHVGDSVLYKKDMVGDKITIEDEEYIMFREHDLMMVDSKIPNSFTPSKKMINEIMGDMKKNPPKDRILKEGDSPRKPNSTFKSEF